MGHDLIAPCGNGAGIGDGLEDRPVGHAQFLKRRRQSDLPDKPGQLVQVAQLIAEEQGNVIKLDHNQFVSTNRQEGVELRITIEAFGTEHKNRIVKRLEEGGFRPRLVKIMM